MPLILKINLKTFAVSKYDTPPNQSDQPELALEVPQEHATVIVQSNPGPNFELQHPSLSVGETFVYQITGNRLSIQPDEVEWPDGLMPFLYIIYCIENFLRDFVGYAPQLVRHLDILDQTN
jgi:hypothetical protein